MSEFNFNSQICTTREQSQRLLSLGLKKETADMCWQTTTLNGEAITYPSQDVWLNGSIITNNHFPAWSLHRLIEMGFNSLALLEDADDEDEIFFMAYKNPFESMLEMFEWLIKEGYFNKEYLV